MKRLILYTRNPIQTKYLVVVFMSMLLPMVTMFACMVLLMRWFIADYGLMPSEVHQHLILVYDQIKYMWAFSLTISFVVMLLWSLYVSHRLVGPITRLERELDAVLGGDMNVDIHVRPKDDLKGIADRINQLVRRLRPR